MRIMAVDYGDARTGIAISDATGLLAGFTTVIQSRKADVVLEKIAELLKAFPNNDLLISGHTALSGTMESCQVLSEQRAEAVADYLKKLGVKDAYHIFTRGFGASKPIGDNSTEAGMSKNRRVEITIIN